MTRVLLNTKEEEILESLLYLQMRRTTILGKDYSNETIPVSELVQRLEQSCADDSTHSATLNIITRKLAAEKEGGAWLEFEPHVGVRFTEKGLSYAKGLLRKHRLAERFLVEILDIPIEEAHDEACHLEHKISDRVADQIELKLGSDQAPLCPHGFPIPSKNGEIPRTQFTVLSELEAPRKVIVRGSINEDSQFLRELRELGLIPGTALTLNQSPRLSENLSVSLSTAETVKELILPRTITSVLLVELAE
ncbi:MAG: metal-dependent transcriptional regulator [Candidatus Thorarchaeota archaeon]